MLRIGTIFAALFLLAAPLTAAAASVSVSCCCPECPDCSACPGCPCCPGGK